MVTRTIASDIAAIFRGNDDLVCQFCRVSTPDVTNQCYRCAHDSQNIFHLFKGVFGAANHDRQRALDRLGFSAAYRCIEHDHTFFFGFGLTSLARLMGR